MKAWGLVLVLVCFVFFLFNILLTTRKNKLSRYIIF